MSNSSSIVVYLWWRILFTLDSCPNFHVSFSSQDPSNVVRYVRPVIGYEFRSTNDNTSSDLYSTTTMALLVAHHLPISVCRAPCLASTVIARKAFMSAFRNNHVSPRLLEQPPVAIPAEQIPSSSSISADAAAPQTAAPPPPVPKAARPRPTIRATKAALALVSCVLTHFQSSLLTLWSQTPAAVSRLRSLLNGPTPQLIRIGVRNKGCAGLSYHLDYVDKPGKFDEIVAQDGVRVLIDSKALFSIIGSEMDWKEDALR